MSMQLQAQMKPSAPSFTTVQTGLQRKYASNECAERSKRWLTLKRSSTNQAEPSGAPSIVHDVLRSPGQPLNPATRAFMEPRFRHDFSRVRVHTDAKAAESARAMNALAYTVGEDVVLRAGQYAPGTIAGNRLLVHELTHVVQQQSGQAAGVQKQSASDKLSDPLEDEAEKLADELDMTAAESIEENVFKGEHVEVVFGSMPNPTELAAASTLKTAAPKKKAPVKKSKKKPAVVKKVCSGDTPPDKVIVNHTVTPKVIEKPNDKVTFTVTFACRVKGDFFSKFMAPDGSEFRRESFPKGVDKHSRKWDGKKPFSKVGTFLVNDGDYFHRIEPVKYAIKNGKDLYTTGTKHDSPIVKVKARSFKGSRAHHFHFTSANVKMLANIIQTEMGGESDIAKRAVAWAVRNQMIRIGTRKVQAAANTFKDRHEKPANTTIKKIATEILKKPMSNDFTKGAIKWFSPNAQPKEEEKCSGSGCDGGLDTFTDEAGNKKRVHTPMFHKEMTFVPISGIREWRVRFYRL